ncbi:MAG: ABC transporter permease [Oscillospiraceae bacterium]
MKNDIVRRFCKHKMNVFAFAVLILIALFCFVGPLVITQDPLKQDLLNQFAPASVTHLFGTDNLGRDIFARMVYGGRTSMIISLQGVIAGTLIGVLIGVFAGFYGGWLDTVLSRLIDILLAFPGLLLAIVVVAILGPGTQNTVYAIAIFSIPGIARMVRGQVMTLRGNEYISASRVIGESNMRIVFTHIVPNAMSQIIVNVTLNLGTAILTSSGLSFLGLGVQLPNPEWGAMLSQAREIMRSHPMSAIIPGIAITLTVLSFSLVGDGLRDALDPRLKNT